MPPIFLDLEEILEIYCDQIERYGGSLGIRDMGLLESALAVPRSGMGDTYFHTDLFEMAAAYLFYLVKNHPFVDGNKRAGAMAAFVFLKLNGITLKAPAQAFERLVRSIAKGEADKATATQFFRKHSKT